MESRKAQKAAGKLRFPRLQNDAVEGARQDDDRRRPEMVIVIGLVAVISMAFGFALGLLF